MTLRGGGRRSKPASATLSQMRAAIWRKMRACGLSGSNTVSAAAAEAVEPSNRCAARKNVVGHKEVDPRTSLYPEFRKVGDAEQPRGGRRKSRHEWGIPAYLTGINGIAEQVTGQDALRGADVAEAIDIRRISNTGHRPQPVRGTQEEQCRY